MYTDEIIQGMFVRLRCITPDDAEFSYNLRKTSETVGVQAKDVEAQRQYIIQQQKKEGDWYFVVESLEGEKIGLFGVYDIDGDSAETGREINIGSPAQIMEAPYLSVRWAHNKLGINRICYVVYKDNKTQISNNTKCGRYPVREVFRSGHDALEYIVSYEDWLKGEQKIIEKLKKLAKMQK